MTDLPRLLILGTSHIAAPRMAYVDASERWPGRDVDFVGMPGRGMAGLVQDDGVLRPAGAAVADRMRRYNLVDHVDLRDYAGFAIVGGASFASTAGMIAGHRGADFSSVSGGVPDEVQIVSSAFLDAMLDERMQGAVATRLLTQLAPLGRPVAMLPAPLPSADCHRAEQFVAYADMVVRGDHRIWRDFYDRARCRAHGDRAILLDWPVKAVVESAYTRPDLMHGSMRLDIDDESGHAEDDFIHGNAQYGALVMDLITQAIDAVLS